MATNKTKQYVPIWKVEPSLNHKPRGPMGLLTWYSKRSDEAHPPRFMLMASDRMLMLIKQWIHLAGPDAANIGLDMIHEIKANQ